MKIFLFNKTLIHIQQKSHSCIFNKNHIQQKLHSHSTNHLIHIQQIPEAVGRLSHPKILQNGGFLREEIRACVQEELQRIKRTPNQTSNANLVQRTRSLIAASGSSASHSLARNA